MRYWPVGVFHDNTTRLISSHDCLPGYLTAPEAWGIIQKILQQQIKPHHVTYQVESASDLAALQAKGVLV